MDVHADQLRDMLAREFPNLAVTCRYQTTYHGTPEYYVHIEQDTQSLYMILRPGDSVEDFVAKMKETWESHHGYEPTVTQCPPRNASGRKMRVYDYRKKDVVIIPGRA